MRVAQGGTAKLGLRWLSFAALGVVAALLAYHAAGVVIDALAVIRYRFGLDYGEGIVWQQALLMFSPRMYSPSQELPFIVFHYPPLYHSLVRLLLVFGLDPLVAGRLISMVSTSISAVVVALLVVYALPGQKRPIHLAVACASAVMFLCLDPVRQWGSWMRVDMLAVALGLLGTLIAIRSKLRVTGLTIALLLCVASLFAKQTHLPAGISIFVVCLIAAPRNTLIASLIAGTAGVAAVVVLEVTTHGFLKNIISYNVNPFDLTYAGAVLWTQRQSGPFVLCMVISACFVAARLVENGFLERIRRHDRVTITQSILLLHFILACLTTLQILKLGSSSNYFLDMMSIGCVLLGLLSCALLDRPLPLAILAVLLALSIQRLPYRYYSADRMELWTQESERLVQLIAASPKPIASDDMVLVLRGGKSIVFEPAIVRVLIATGAWDPAPLLAMLRNREFGFVLENELPQAGPVISAAVAENYPSTRVAKGTLMLHSQSPQ